MAILNFPATGPGTPDDGSFTSTQNGVLYVWDGNKWTANSESDLDSRYVERAGDNMTGSLTLGGDKITLNAGDGSAEFAGATQVNDAAITAGGSIYCSSNSGLGNLVLKKITDGNGYLECRNAANGQEVSIGPGGSATFKGAVTAAGCIGQRPTSSGTGPDSDWANIISRNKDGDLKARINADGSASFAGDVVGGPGNPLGGANTGTLLSTEGMVVASRAENNQDVWRGYNNVAGTTSLIRANGSATFGAVDPNASDKVGINWGVGGASITLKTQGTSAINGTQTNGYELFRGNIKVYSINYAGTSTFSNAIFNLEADDDTKYTATTDADGNETRVYNGAVLDVKDRLTKLDTALSGLKAALVSTTDHASLKAALITALADI